MLVQRFKRMIGGSGEASRPSRSHRWERILEKMAGAVGENRPRQRPKFVTPAIQDDDDMAHEFTTSNSKAQSCHFQLPAIVCMVSCIAVLIFIEFNCVNWCKRMSGDDLSDYERLRLENIRRNAEFLAGLGLQDVLPVKAAVVKEKVQSVGKRKREDFEARKALEQPVRRSRRVQLLQEGLKLSQVDDEEEIEIKSEPDQRSYEDMPFDSNELDDFEFQVFVALKAWRLKTSRELDIEPYKICQNRTLAELVRRRRNDSSWAIATKSETDRECDLLECWGIGPSKAKQDGFGDLLMKEIDTSDRLEDYLAKSRLIGNIFPTTSSE